MNYRRLGRSGLTVSEICLGAWINFGGRIPDEETFAVLDTAVEEGIDFFDTADVYAAGEAEDAREGPADPDHRDQVPGTDVARTERRGRGTQAYHRCLP